MRDHGGGAVRSGGHRLWPAGGQDHERPNGHPERRHGWRRGDHVATGATRLAPGHRARCAYGAAASPRQPLRGAAICIPPPASVLII